MAPRCPVFLAFLLLFAVACSSAGDNPKRVIAVRCATPPVIDGIVRDEVWHAAEPATGFTQRDPDEGNPASEQTEIRVLYDDTALYFGCLFLDSRPDAIVARLSRRDDETESDRGSIRIDAFHDSQTAYEFTFNAAGVKVDIVQYDDAAREDESWDPVWDLETHITSEGWTAEVRIPFSILRYQASEGDTAEQEWGINFIRYIPRRNETDRWVFTPKSESGFVSRFGHLGGLRSLPSPHRLTILPYVAGRQTWDPPTSPLGQHSVFTADAGIDLKLGIGNNLTLDATVNPDFGQLEADPAVLNLSTFETFYPERRPFFIEGTQIIRFATFGDDGGPGLFYSRRIGRAISPEEAEVPPGGRIEKIPQHVTILGAAKLTGKFAGGMSLGVLQAVTREEVARVVDAEGSSSEQVLEPLALYNVARFRQDVLSGSYVGGIVTSVARASRLPAFTGGADWNLKLESSAYQLDGFLAGSHTTNGTGERISGSAGKLQFQRLAARHWLWFLEADFTTPGYNINDIGFFRRPNDFGGIFSLKYKEDAPASVVRSYAATLMLHERSNFDGANIFRTLGLKTDILLDNYWQVSAAADLDVGQFDDRETRGYGLYRKPTGYSAGLALETDDREALSGGIFQTFGWDERGKRQWTAEGWLECRPASWSEYSVEAGFGRVRNQEAWVENVDLNGNGVATIFGDRETQEVSLTVRGSMTFTRDLTLQIYGQLFLAKGHYSGFRQMVAPDTFVPYPYGGNPDFNTQTFNTNLVLRWEYLPGSTMFLVWSQARDAQGDQYFTSFHDDLRGTFHVPPANVIMLKVSYWWGG